MKRIVHGIFVTVVLMTCSGCSTFIGDQLLDLTNRSTDDRSKLMGDARQHATNLLKQVDIPESTKETILRNIYSVTLPEKNPNFLYKNLVLIKDNDVQIEKVLNSLIISTGSLNIRSSNRNFIVSGGAVTIENEGDAGMSIIFSRGAVKISRARETIIYTLGQVEISYTNYVEVLDRTIYGGVGND